MPAERGTTVERGYGRDHKLKRAEYQKAVDAGVGECWRCGKAVEPGDEWHLGHDDVDREVWRGIECPPCNLEHGGRKGALVTNTARAMTTREW